MRIILISLLKFYKAVISPWLPPSCRFTPTCSEYAREAIERHGAVKGVRVAIWRLLRCQPFSAGGYEPRKKFAIKRQKRVFTAVVFSSAPAFPSEHPISTLKPPA